jgi:hypothetical protein
MTSYSKTSTMKKFMKIGFFIIKIHYISSNNPNITDKKKIILGVSHTLKTIDF